MNTALPSFVVSGSGPPVVLVMGLGAPGSAWSPHEHAWSRAHTCITIDNRGAGRTALGTEGLTTQLMAADVADLLDAHKTGPCDIVGISLGGCIAQELALSRPDLVKKLVLVASWIKADPAMKSTLNVLGHIREEASTHTFNEALRNLIWSAEWIDTHSGDAEESFRAEPATTSEAFRAQAAACATHDTLTRLGTVTAPTLVTYGTNDIFVRPELSIALASAISGSTRHEFAGGHVHHWEQLGPFNDLVEQWLS